MSDRQCLARLKNGQLDQQWERRQKECFCAHSEAVRIVTGANRLAALWWPNSAQSGTRRLRVFPF